MKECRWLKPVLVGRFEFVEWTPDDHLRHSRFVGVRDKKATDVVRESGRQYYARSAPSCFRESKFLPWWVPDCRTSRA